MLDDHDEVIAALTRRILAPSPDSKGYELADLIEALARLFESQQSGAPAACLGPLLPGATLVGGARVPGTSLELEPSQAAYCVAWLCADATLGALLPLTDYLARRAVLTGARPLRVSALLQACAQTRELAASIALPAPFAGAPITETLALRVAVAGVASRLLGASDAEVAAALSLAFAEGLAPHESGSARACAAAASAGVRVALLARAGAPALPRILGSRPDGFEARLLGGARVQIVEVTSSARSTDPLLAWHRLQLAVQRRFAERPAARLLASVHADAGLEALAVQSFVALLVRAS